MKKNYIFLFAIIFNISLFGGDLKFLKTNIGKLWVEEDESYEYDSSGKLIKKIKNSESHKEVSSFSYNDNGFLSYKNENGTEYTYFYDENGKLIKTTISGTYNDSTISYEYDDNLLIHEKQLEKYQFGKPSELWYEYDSNNQLIREIEHVFDYEKKDKIAGKNESKYTYNKKGQRISKSFYSKNYQYSEVYEYNEEGYLCTIFSGTTTTRYFYDYEIILDKKLPKIRYSHKESN